MPTTDEWLWVLSSRVGEAEDPPGSNCCPVCRAYGPIGGVRCYAWCCATQDLVLEAVFGTRLLGTASVGFAAQRARNGENFLEWIPADGEIRVGDLHCIDFSGRGDWSRFHIGGVINPGTQDRFETIEGNLGNRCQRLWRDRRYVFGFIRPPFSTVGLGIPPAAPLPEPPPPRRPLIMLFLVRAADHKAGAIYVTDRIHKRWIHDLDELGRIQRQLDRLGVPSGVQEWIPAELERIPTVGDDAPGT